MVEGNLKQYFDVIRYAIEPDRDIVPSVDGIDWQGLYRFSCEQAIAGVVFEGIRRLGEHGVKPPFGLLMEWVGTAEQIKGRNKAVNEAVFALFQELNSDGLRGCVLKGQGNNLKYSNVYTRTPGDIDVWVKMSKGRSLKNDVRGIIRYVRKQYHQARAVYHHIDYGSYKDVEVEVHYRPSFMFNPIHNSRLQKWFRDNADEQFQHVAELPDGVGAIAVTTTEFNIIFQLSHIYNHLLHEGIGLRQIIDYYYLLRNAKDKLKIENGELIITLRYLGLEKIAGAMMWVLNEVLGLPEKYLIASKDEKRGRLLISEIMKGGNFGHYDDNNRKATTAVKKNAQRLKRDFRMMCYFPSECLWEPIFRVYHYFWRLRYN